MRMFRSRKRENSWCAAKSGIRVTRAPTTIVLNIVRSRTFHEPPSLAQRSRDAGLNLLVPVKVGTERRCELDERGQRLEVGF